MSLTGHRTRILTLNKPYFNVCFSFIAIITLACLAARFFLVFFFFTVRVKGGMSLQNGMWHGLGNDLIMGNVIYAE